MRERGLELVFEKTVIISISRTGSNPRTKCTQISGEAADQTIQG